VRLGVPLGTVKSWTRRGLNRLATLLGEETSG
jgi:DNA-directed RNA polymerase specialized sigma24 family protein